MKPTSANQLSARTVRREFTLVFIGWLLTIAILLWLMIVTGVQPQDLVRNSLTILQSPFGPLLFMAIFAIRPILLFPSSLLLISATAIFRTPGFLYAFIGYNLAAITAYCIGRWFRNNVSLPVSRMPPLVAQLLQANAKPPGFLTVLILRLLFLPQDIDSYLAGTLRIKPLAFVCGSMLGSLPGIITCGLIGLSIPVGIQTEATVSRFDPRLLAQACAVLALGLAGQWLIRQRVSRVGKHPSNE